MSRFMSHREMKAASRVLGDYQFRTEMLERVIRKLLERQELSLVLDEQTGEVDLLTKADLLARQHAEEAAAKEAREARAAEEVA